MRILIINVEIPFPPVGGGHYRTYNLLKALAKKHDLTLVGFKYENRFDSPPFPVEVIGVPWQYPPLYEKMYSDDPVVSQNAHEALKGIDLPWFVSYFQSSAMSSTLEQLSQETFELIFVEDTDMAQFLPFLPSRVPKILDFHNVYSLMAKRAIENHTGEGREKARREAERTLEFEKRVASYFKLCLTCSKPEAEAAKSLLGIDRVEVVPNGVDTKFFTPGKGGVSDGYLLFTGSMSYQPNIEAVHFFTKNILPLIREKVPGAKLHIVGRNPSREVLCLASEGVIIHGFVPDMRPYFQKANVVVVPLLHGGGTRLKILEAAACGKAVVSTSFGAEGLDFKSGRDILIADTPSQFAGSVISLIQNRELVENIGKNAREVSLDYDWNKIGSKVLRIVKEYAQ